MSLYGTRDAAKNWQDEVARMTQIWGFRFGQYNPCLFKHDRWDVLNKHDRWDVLTLVHGDDFVSVGEAENLKFWRVLEERSKVKTQVVDSGGGEEVKEARVLNRVLRVTAEGVTRDM